MSVEGMSVFITQYIAERRQKKLEAFDKEAAKRGAEDSAALAQERYELAHRYEPKNWLTDAAKRAGQISLVTHAANLRMVILKAAAFFPAWWLRRDILTVQRSRSLRLMP